jgi:hypothetical protein
MERKAPIAATKKDAKKNIVPKFTIKKKRKRDGANGTDTSRKVAVPKEEKSHEAHADKKRGGSADGNAQNSEGDKNSSPKATENDSESDEGGGLLGLACYGSDSD